MGKAPLSFKNIGGADISETLRTGRGESGGLGGGGGFWGVWVEGVGGGGGGGGVGGGGGGFGGGGGGGLGGGGGGVCREIFMSLFAGQARKGRLIRKEQVERGGQGGSFAILTASLKLPARVRGTVHIGTTEGEGRLRGALGLKTRILTIVKATIGIKGEDRGGGGGRRLIVEMKGLSIN